MVENQHQGTLPGASSLVMKVNYRKCESIQKISKTDENTGAAASDSDSLNELSPRALCLNNRKFCAPSLPELELLWY